MTLVTAMPVAAAARIVGEHDTLLWRIVIHYVEKALAAADFSKVTRIAVDETAAETLDQIEHLRPAGVAIAAHQDFHLRPVPPDAADDAAQDKPDHGI